MIVGTCTIELFLPGNGSLKEKRRTLKSIKDRIQHRFNVSIAEVEDQDLWQKAVLGIACVGNQKAHVNEVLDKVLRAIRGTPEVEVMNSRLEMI